MKNSKTPLCNCYGHTHPMGSFGCILEVTEKQLEQDDSAIAELVRQRTGIKASDKVIIHHIRDTVAEYNRDRIKRRLYFAGGMLCLIAIVALLIWGRG